MLKDKNFKLHLACISILWCFASCTPSIYLIDRQTVLELEASGDWQELDANFHNQEVASGPLPLEKTRERIDRRQVFNITHSDNDAGAKKSSQDNSPAKQRSQAR